MLSVIYDLPKRELRAVCYIWFTGEGITRCLLYMIYWKENYVLSVIIWFTGELRAVCYNMIYWRITCCLLYMIYWRITCCLLYMIYWKENYVLSVIYDLLEGELRAVCYNMIYWKENYALSVIYGLLEGELRAVCYIWFTGRRITCCLL